jgi:hypothetical protein
MRRIFSCFNGHVPAIKTLPTTNKVFLVCHHPDCQVSTSLHLKTQHAIDEWNNGGSDLWRAYDRKWWHWFARWWHGVFY